MLNGRLKRTVQKEGDVNTYVGSQFNSHHLHSHEIRKFPLTIMLTVLKTIFSQTGDYFLKY